MTDLEQRLLDAGARLAESAIFFSEVMHPFSCYCAQCAPHRQSIWTWRALVAELEKRK